MRRNVMLLVLLLFAFSTLIAQDMPPDTHLEVIIDGLPRELLIHVADSYSDESSAPLMISLHPTASSPKAMQIQTDLDRVADELGGIVVYPRSYTFAWNTGSIEAGISKFENPADDVEFLSKLIDYMAENYNIDRQNVNMVGFGAGGIMAQRMACERPELFSHVISVAPLLMSFVADLCPEFPSASTNLLLVHGTSDPFYRMHTTNHPAMGGVDLSYDALGVAETMQYWSDYFGCTNEFTERIDNVMILDDCQNGGQVSYFGVVGGVSTWYRVGDYHLNQFDVDLTRLVADFITSDSDEWRQRQVLVEDQHPRSYTVYVPESYDPSVPAPVVMVLHGRPSNGVEIAVISDMNSTADKYGFIAVYPDGQFIVFNEEIVDRFWGYTRDNPYYAPVPEDDVQYLKDLLDDIAVDFNVDRQRAYVTGFSNGGFMTHRVACEAYDTFAAFAPLGAGGYAGMDQVCDFTPPVPLLYIHGTDDVSVPFQGSASPVGDTMIWTLWPAIGTATYWAAHNGCDENQFEEETIPSSGETSVTVVEFGGCEEHPVRFYLIANGGHNWPGVPGIISDRIAGKVNTDIHASDEIWQFFSRFTLQEELAQTDSE